MNNRFDVLIPCAHKDLCKLSYCISHIKQNIMDFENIYVVSPEKVVLPGIVHVFDKDIMDINEHGWIKQQFIKLFQNITKNDYYLTIDADVVVLSKLDMFDENRPIWYFGRNQYNPPYFEFQKQVFGYGRQIDHSFINDMNFFNKQLILEMLRHRNYTIESLFDKYKSIKSDTCYPCEADLYGSFVVRYYDLYKFRKLKTGFIGKKDELWSSEELENNINKAKNKGLHLFAMHTWLI